MAPWRDLAIVTLPCLLAAIGSACDGASGHPDGDLSTDAGAGADADSDSDSDSDADSDADADAAPDGDIDPDGGPPPPVACTPGPGDRYFVGPDGADENPGTEDSPFRTLARAADTAQPGDTVYLLAGTYAERLVPPRSGTEGNPITFASAPGGEPAIIDGTGVAVGEEALVFLQGVSYVQICGMVVRSSAYHGVAVTKFYEPEVVPEHILVSGLTVERSGQAAIIVRHTRFAIIDSNITRGSVSSGVGVWYSSDVTVSHNQVVNARDDEVAGHEESISISGTERFDVYGNEVYLEGVPGYLGNEGIDVKESSRDGRVHDNYIHDYPGTGGSIYLDAWTAGLDGTPTLSTIDVYRNRLVRTSGISIGSERGGTVEHVRVFNNLVVDANYTGIRLGTTGGDGPRRDISIWNNTIHGATAHGGAGIYLVTTNIQGVVIQNNLVAFSPGTNGQIVAATDGALGEITVDHNLVSGPTECSLDYPACVELSEVRPENVTADPLLASPGTLDFHLLPGSPAIDTGLALPLVTDDLDGTARPQGAAYDIGAFEWH
jgi:hypothetical protein